MKMPIEPIGTGVIPTLNPSEHTLYPSKKSYNFDLPIVCHGYASVLSIQISAFRESGDKSFLITRERNMRQTIISHRNCIFNDEYTNDYCSNIFD